MSRDPESFEQDDSLSRERKPSEPVSGEKIRDNLLLLSGIGLLLLASGMVLSNLFS
ncbi:hypothetical protein CLV41_10353 [Roseibium marinum]|uniref:Uncharacterized protein n=1 Tax=Roseibium marinum TaxID=281252 RepID=A0A2S3UWT0_9HYPH|nr:hypothetical protein CLV41_10353 [Roseibium marinum]